MKRLSRSAIRHIVFLLKLLRPVLGLAFGTWLLIGCAKGQITPVGTTKGAQLTTVPCAGTVRLDVQPDSAAVYVDGVEQQPDERLFRLLVGNHTIEFSQDGFEAQNLDVDVVCDQAMAVAVQLRDVAPPNLMVEEMPARIDPQDGLKVRARATDNQGIVQIELAVDGAPIHTVSESSLSYNIDTRDLADGPHELLLVATDLTWNRVQWQSVFNVYDLSVERESDQPQSLDPPTDIPEPTSTRRPPTTTPVPSVTATASPTLAPTQAAPTSTATPEWSSVQAYWDSVTIATYDYEDALYVDAKEAGHPYPLLYRDRIGPVVGKSYDLIILRNEYLELSIMPELGGRIYQCTFLPTSQALFYNNPVIKPSHWGPEDQGWWLAVGGLEFCLPVNEHGYLTAQPWDAEIWRNDDDSVTVWVSTREQTRGLLARVGITLAPDEARFGLETSLRNDTDMSQSFQYWLNGMMSPGKASIGPRLRFYYPTTKMIVHSRGSDSLPNAGENMTWPLYKGLDFSTYDTWQNWLGVFVESLDAEFSAVYDEETEIGMVRSFPADIVPGVKLFAFGQGFGDSRAYTDDGSQYAEMWGGITDTFWDDISFQAREEIHWTEYWYPASHCGGVTMANDQATLYVEPQEKQLQVFVFAPMAHSWRLLVSSGQVALTDEDFSVDPETVYHAVVPLRTRNVGEPILVHILDGQDNSVLSYTLAP